MARGDRRSRKGKIVAGTFGVTRPRTKRNKIRTAERILNTNTETKRYY